MRSKIISLLLAFVMIFTMIPAAAFAETEGTGLIEVTVNVAPSTVNVTFYEGDDATDPIPAEQVTDNGIVEKYHQYVLKVEKGRYSYRGVDSLGTEGDTSDDRNLGGMAFNVPLNDEIMEDGSVSTAGQTLTLRNTNFYTTNASITAIGDYRLELYPAGLPAAVTGDTYIGTIGSNATERIITPVLAMARGNALTYQGTITLKPELAETYGVANIVNYTIGTGTSVNNKTFSLATLQNYTITAPKEAKAQVFNQINNFNVEELQQKSETDNGDGTVTHLYKLISGNKTYRVSMKGKITRAGYFKNSEDVVVTYDENENPSITGHALDNANIQKRMEASTMVNINGQNNLKLGTGETFRLRAYRGAWQIIDTDTANIMIEPDFNYEVISGEEHIEMTPASNKCTGNAGTGDSSNWMDIKGVSAGTAVIEVSYDAIQIGGEGTTFDGLYGATDPQRTSLIVINVGETENTLKMQAAGAANLWDTEYDTVYFTGENGTLNFTATMDGATPDKVELSTDKGESWSDVTEAEGIYTAKGLIGGNNILRFTKGSKVEYQVVRAAKVTYTVQNLSRDGEEIITGDEVKIVFKGLYTPISKFSGIYNPGYGKGHKVIYDLPEGTTAESAGGQYDFISTNSYTVTTSAAGMLTLTGGHVEFNVMGVEDIRGGHRILTDAGVGTNFSAVSTMHTRGVLPDITLEVTEMPYTPVTVAADIEGTEITVADTDGNGFTGENGVYSLPYGTYKYTAVKEGYIKETGRFKVTKADYLQGSKSISVKMRKIEGAIWDGATLTKPALTDGVYQIGTGAELAWFAKNANGTSYNAILTDDISLGGFDWTPIANSSAWKGTFDGNGHYVTDLYINSTSNNVALFGYVGAGAVIKNLGVKGEVTTTGKYAAGIATAKATTIAFSIENCKSEVNVTADITAAGIVANQSAKITVKNCYNTGDIKVTKEKSSSLTAGGVSCPSSQTQKVVIENCYNTGNISGVGKHGSVVYLSSASYAANVKNCYGLEGTCGTKTVAGTDVTEDELKALAPTLGDAFFDDTANINNGYPVLNWEAAVTESAVKEAKAAVTDYVKLSDYREEQQSEVEQFITEGNTALDKAATMFQLENTLAAIKASIDTVKTDAQLTAAELAAAKVSAKEEIAAYKNAADYREAEAAVLAEIVAEATAAIENAAVIADIEPLVDAAKSEMDALKTDAQLTAAELATAKDAAKAALTAYKEAADYREAEAETLADILKDAAAAIDGVKVITEIQAIVDKATADMDALKTDAQLTAEELAAAKISAKAEIAAYKNAADYRTAEAEALVTIVTEATAAIENAEVIGTVQETLAKAKADMDTLKTDAQLTAEELAAAKETAVAEIESYKNFDDYRLLQKIELESVVNGAVRDINDVTVITEIQAIVDAAKADMDVIKTDAQLTAEEELAAAKTAGIKELKKYKNADAYREAEKKTLAEIIEAAEAEIEAATDIAEVEELVEKAKDKLDKVKTDDQLSAEESLTAAERAQLAAEEAKAAAEEAQQAAEEALAEAEAAQKAAEDAQAKAEESQKAAEKAKADADATKAETEKLAAQAAADKAAAETARKEAEAAREAAEKVLEEAETAGQALKAEAEAAQKAAEEAQAKAEASQKAAEQAKADADATKAEVEKLAEKVATDKAAAEIAKAAAETAKTASEKNLAVIEELKAEAEALAAQAAADKAAAEQAKAEAEKAKEAAEKAKAEAEKLANQAAADEAAAEQAKLDAEKAKAEAEAAKKAAKEAESNANATQVEVEKLKAEAEVKAAEAEMAQLAAEEAQAKAETAQAAAEVAKAEAEAAIATTEAERAAAEQAKADAIAAKEAAEAAQAEAEAAIEEAAAVKAELEETLAQVQARLDELNSVKTLAVPANLKAGNVAKTGKIVLTWKGVKGADEYVVYRAKSKNGAYRKMFTTTGTKYINTNAKAGTTYYYKVKAVSDSKKVENSKFSKIVKRTCDLKRPVATAKSKTKKQVKLTWKRVKGADRYVVYRSNAKNGTYKKIYTTKKLKLINIKLKSGKTYYYKVKAIDKDKPAANSAFSFVVKIKCK